MQSLLEFISRYAAGGDEIAVRHRRGYRMETWTYGRIVAEANRLARELEARGITKGDAVLLWGENSAEWIVAFFGCLISGVVIVPIDHASTTQFAARVVQQTNAKLLFRARNIRGSDMALPQMEFESIVEQVARRDSATYASPKLDRQDTLEIIFTSGTTAEPRGVVISHGNVLANLEPLIPEIQKYRRYERIFHPIRFLNLVPLSHIFGQMMGVFIPPLLTGVVVFFGSLKPSEVMDGIRRERISVMVAVPRVIESLQRETQRQAEHEGHTREFQERFARGEHEHFLRRWWRFRRIHARLGWKFWAFVSGGAALPERVETFWTRLGYAVIQGYGMTETTALISLNHPFRSTKGSIGRVFPGMEIRVDETGEILVRGESVAKAYRHQNQVAPVLESDGWFRTGDLAERDKDGQLYFKGRRKNVIVTPAGMNIYPEDLEKALRGQSGVRDCVVIGVERDGNAEPCAVLLMDRSASNPASAVESANQTLAEYQRVRQWFVWPEPDFPRTPTHKPLLPRIREVVAAQSGVASPPANGGSLAALISQITGRPVKPGSQSAGLETDLRMSSLDRVELMSALEDRYQTDLSEIPFSEAATVGQLEKLLKEHPGAVAEHGYARWPQHWLTTLFRLAVYYLLAWPATYLLAAPRIRGRENLRGLHGPVLVVSNHVTYLDVAWVLPALPAHLRHRLATAMRGERLAEMRRPSKELNLSARLLERLRYFLVLSLFNVFPLPKESGFLKSFAFAGDLADRGWNILIFPEGLTSVDGRLASFRSGIGLLSKQLGIPVVPMRLDGLYDLKQTNRIIASPGHVRVTIGKPVRFASERDPEDITRELERRVAEL